MLFGNLLYSAAVVFLGDHRSLRFHLILVILFITDAVWESSSLCCCCVSWWPSFSAISSYSLYSLYYRCCLGIFFTLLLLCFLVTLVLGGFILFVAATGKSNDDTSTYIRGVSLYQYDEIWWHLRTLRLTDDVFYITRVSKVVNPYDDQRWDLCIHRRSKLSRIRV